MSDRVIATKHVWSYNEPGLEGKPVKIESEWFKTLCEVGVGNEFSVGMGAPGGGYIKYRIDRITKTKVFGTVVEDTSYILTEADVI